MRKLQLAIVAVLLTLVVAPVTAQRQPTDVLQTIQPISVSTLSAVAGCTVLQSSPGTVISGQSGWILTYCSNAAAITFNGTTETPTFVLATGWDTMQIVLQGFNCPASVVRQISGSVLTGVNITSGQPVAFLGRSDTTIPAGGYNYCLHYNNAPITGILSFTISWHP